MSKKDNVASIEAFREKYGSVADKQRGIDVISSGLFMLDWALGVGGFPRGRIVELYGAEASGKSTISMATAAECQKRGLGVLYIDFEHSLSEDYCKLFGFDVVGNPLFIAEQPDSAEKGAAMTRDALSSHAFGLIVWDSIASMATQAQIDEPDKEFVAPLARFLAPEFRRLVPAIDDAQAILMLINHVHQQIGVVAPGGRPAITTPGGKSIKHYASIRIETRVTGPVMGQRTDPITGKRMRDAVASMHLATVKKNKVAMPGRRANFFIRDGWGLCEPEMLLKVMTGRGLAKQSGPYYVIEGIPDKFQGLEPTLDYLRNNPSTYQALLGKVKAMLLPEEDSSAVVDEDSLETFDESSIED